MTTPLLRCAASLAAAALMGCASSTPPPARAPADVLLGAWPLQLVLDDTVTNAAIDDAARWLGPATWLPPFAASSPRHKHEDALAVAMVSALHDAAACALAETPQALPPEPPTLLATAQAACTPSDSAGAWTPQALEPVVDAALDVAGETLRWRLLTPGVGALALRAQGARGGSGFDARVGSGRWTPAEQPDLPSAEALWAAHHASYAALESAAEEEISRWRHGLATVDAEALDATTEGVVLGWVRRALYRDLGLAALRDGDADLARPLLEEAAGAVPRPRPGEGRDPVLLAGLASARFQAGELSRSVELLSDMGSQLGWEFAAIPAELVARVAVLPSPSQPRVRR